MTEYQHQRTVMEWSCYASNRIRYPGLDLLYHIPNEIKCNAAQGKQRKVWRTGFVFAGCTWAVSRVVHRDESGTGQSIRESEDMVTTIDGAGVSCKGLLWI